MRLKTKSLLLTFVGTLTFAALISAGAIYAFTSSSLTGLALQSHMAAELIRLTITHEMGEGKPEHIRPYLRNLTHVPGLTHAHVVPAESVIQQMNIDISTHDPASALEKKVFATGKDAQELIDGDPPLFHYAIPYVANSSCLQCHAGDEGDILGVVSIEIDMSEQRNAMFISVFGMLLLFLLFGAVMSFLLRRLMAPVIGTTKELKRAVDRAESGDFSVRLKKRSNDEIGEIAEQVNHFMQTLENSFGDISKKVEALTGTYNSNGKDLLRRTMEVVNNLVSATQFKQSIENDRNLEEVYARLCRVLKYQFGLSRFSLYEVSNSKNHMQLIAAEGLPDTAELWCDLEITIDCDTCRAKRTAQQVSSVDENEICGAFGGNRIQHSEQLLHVCMPVMLSGSVGGVLQVLFTEAEATQVQKDLATLQIYMDEAAPVIEAKRLMLSLKDASLRDPMTSLYNRRFLEEYLPTMLATVERQKTSVAILMCDVDFFKQVNDTLGHEAGDEILIKVSEILKQTIRASDLAIRFGGEEFIALLIGADEEKALEVAERLRKSMEDYTFKTVTGPLKKTISVGISLFPADGNVFWGCVKFADVAMYQAKETGRNRVLRFTKDMWKDGENY